MSIETRFILNGRDVLIRRHPGTLVLDYLRGEAKLMGTKEGCREGDCGACTVLIGELKGEKVIYKPVTCCLMPLGELHGKHLVTIEGLNMPRLTPVQQAIVEEGATQCGFCTPGIVVSLTASLLDEETEISRVQVKRALSGHLCRCTGYRSLKASADYFIDAFGGKTGVDTLLKDGILPPHFREIPSRLKKIPAPGIPERGDHTVVAGGTDIYIQQGEMIPESPVSLLNLHPEMKGIVRKNGHIRIGALTTFEEFASDPDILEIIPDIGEYMFTIASWQIRNRATLGGNIINASPIGDMTILLLALESELVLQEGNSIRSVPIASFYKGYKELDKTDSEILTEILIPIPSRKTKIHFEKVSKRKCLDIASVNLAAKIQSTDGVLQDICLAIGGVAPIPLCLKQTGEFLTGQLISRDTIESAIDLVQNEISPISDIRGSETYKRLLARQLMIASFTKLFPDIVAPKAFYHEAY